MDLLTLISTTISILFLDLTQIGTSARTEGSSGVGLTARQDMAF